MAEHAGRRRFVTTRWSLVLAASGRAAPADARAAFAALCDLYWSPVYEYIRRTGRSADDAGDLTQAFFARLLERNDLRAAQSERGRFRAFLLTAVRHFAANQRDFERAAKRGGGQIHVPIGPRPDGETHEFAEPPSGMTPEEIYESQWALATLEAAMKRLRREYDNRGQRRVFDALRSSLTGDTGSPPPDLVEELGLAQASVRVALHRLRRRFGECLRETLAQTVDDPADVDDELRFLLTVVTRPQKSSSLKQG